MSRGSREIQEGGGSESSAGGEARGVTVKNFAYLEKPGGRRFSKRSAGRDYSAVAFSGRDEISEVFGGLISFIWLKIKVNQSQTGC